MAVNIADPLSSRSFYAVTTASFTAATDLNTLLLAAYAALNPTQVIAPVTATELRVFFTAANGKDVLMGDASLTTSNFGMRYQPGTSDKFGTATKSCIPLSNIFVMSQDGATAVTMSMMIFPM